MPQFEPECGASTFNSQVSWVFFWVFLSGTGTLAVTVYTVFGCNRHFKDVFDTRAEQPLRNPLSQTAAVRTEQYLARLVLLDARLVLLDGRYFQPGLKRCSASE